MPRPQLLAILLGILGVAAGAHGQSASDLARARALGKAGTDAFRAGRYDQAIASYQAAYDLAPRPGVLFNIGRAYHKKGDAKHALEYYRRYLTDEPNGPVASEARTYVADLERTLPAAEPPPRSPPPEVPAETPAASPAETAPPPVVARNEPRPAATDAVVLVPVTPAAPAPRWSFGPEIGFAYASFATDFSPTESKSGFTAGGFVGYAASPWLGLRAELLFVQKGNHQEDMTQSIDYLEVPVLVEVSTRGFFAVAGPYLAVKVGASTQFDDVIPSTDAGLVIGAGYALPVGTGALVFQARYDVGLVNIEESYATKTRAFLFTVGFAFR
jgi:Outer membrane protein beta-barrel domain/Tetratricopeptide repeat